MGMYDSFYDADGNEWQTKAYGRTLEVWNIGDEIPGPPVDYQAQVIGGVRNQTEYGTRWSFATIRGGRLVSAGDDRDERLGLLLYGNQWEPAKKEDDGSLTNDAG